MALHIRHTVAQAGNQRCEHEDRDAEKGGEGAAPSTSAGAPTLIAAVAHQGSLQDPPKSATGRKAAVTVVMLSLFQHPFSTGNVAALVALDPEMSSG